MSRLRKRTADGYRELHKHFSTTAMILSIAAMILALGGGAYAASRHNDKKASKSLSKAQVIALIKQYAKQGPAGAAGANGTNGTDGTNGANGGNGAPGASGANGKTVLSGSATPGASIGEEGDFYIKTGASPEIFGPKASSGANGGWGTGTALKGTSGTNGNGVEVESFGPGHEPAGHPCEVNGVQLGGLEVEVENKPPATYICNGTPGENGAIHPGESLPANVTLKGAFFDEASAAAIANEEYSPTSVSFLIPVPGDFFNNHDVLTVAEQEAGTNENCHGTWQEPTAKPGWFCAYVEAAENMSESAISEATLSNTEAIGAKIYFPTTSSTNREYVEGTWAITAE